MARASGPEFVPKKVCRGDRIAETPFEQFVLGIVGCVFHGAYDAENTKIMEYTGKRINHRNG
jgi:hypothetical protein